MITIAAGVCFGILGAVAILNWWQQHLIRRAERRERRAYRKMARAYKKAAQEAEYRARCEAEHEADQQAWLALKAKPSRPPEPEIVMPRDNVLRADIIFWSIIAFMVFCAVMNGLGIH